MPSPPIDSDAYYEIANTLSDFHLARSESLQQRAATLLGFAGVLVALIPLVTQRGADEPTTGTTTTVLVIAATVAIGIAAIIATAVITTAQSRYPSATDVRKHFDAQDLTSEQARSMWASVLLHDTIPDFERHAKDRAKLLRWSTGLLGSGVVFLVVSLVIRTMGCL